MLSKRFSDRYVVIDASKPLEEVSNEVLSIIFNRLGK